MIWDSLDNNFDDTGGYFFLSSPMVLSFFQSMVIITGYLTWKLTAAVCMKCGLIIKKYLQGIAGQRREKRR